MTNEQYEDLKDSYLKHIKRYMKETGGLFPHVTILGDHLDKTQNPTNAIIHVPIPDEFMEDDETKDEFIENVLPHVMKDVKKKFEVYAIAWAAEAWMRKADKDFKITDQNYKELPKTEVLFVSIESENKAESYIYEINRVGMRVGEDGDICDDINLKEITEFGQPEKTAGRFAGLYKKLINS